MPPLSSKNSSDDLKGIKDDRSPDIRLSQLLKNLHENGPKEPKILETLSLIKEFHPETFKKYEQQILSALGLFYKQQEPENLYSLIMSQFKEHYIESYQAPLTPVQANIRANINQHQYTSFSAPTSTGKSYSVRKFIEEGDGDMVIIVPSRALIAEYINTLRADLKDRLNIMVTPFADLVFTSQQLKRIFVLTPERAIDIYKIKNSKQLNIQVFFFDEAHTTDEPERGIIFDITVRRIKKHFPSAKIIFAHPFIENPEAQFSKHHIEQNKWHKMYPYESVGRICVANNKDNKDYYFSPYTTNGHFKKNQLEFDGAFLSFIQKNKKSVLVYVSKASINDQKIKEKFKPLIDACPLLKDRDALKIIESISNIIIDQNGRQSSMIDYLKQGIVIHHGSIPLQVRFLIEEFIRRGYAKICFATSTLTEGINMPFDIIWIHNNKSHGDKNRKTLEFKNLIGRAGRLLNNKEFNYGYIYIYTASPKNFIDKISRPVSLQTESILDQSTDSKDNKIKELIESIKNDTFDDEKNLPKSTIDRLSTKEVMQTIKLTLDTILGNDKTIKENIGGEDNKSKREDLKNNLQKIYEITLNRPLEKGERNVFENAITIFCLILQEYSFKNIVGIRYKNITRQNTTQFSQPASTLPERSLFEYSLFKQGTLSNNAQYDRVVFDTYDYTDKVLSFSLADTFLTAFRIYQEKYPADSRTEQMLNFFRYHTNNEQHILLIRYGFPPEMIDEVLPYIETINEQNITFKPTIQNATDSIKDFTEWYRLITTHKA